jgi:hypothetical protein
MITFLLTSDYGIASPSSATASSATASSATATAPRDDESDDEMGAAMDLDDEDDESPPIEMEIDGNIIMPEKDILNILFPDIIKILDAHNARQRTGLAASTGSPSSPITGTITAINDFADILLQLTYQKEIYILVLFSLIHGIMQEKSPSGTPSAPSPFDDYIPQQIRYSFFESRDEWMSLTDKIGKIYPGVLHTPGDAPTVKAAISSLLRLSGGGGKTRRKKRPSKKRNMKTKRNKRSNNKYTRSNAKKHNSRKLKKKNRKKRTTHRKK